MILAPTPENIRYAAQAIRAGELVGMPTETVYGIAADAFNLRAAIRTFELKGRPVDNPLIVHVDSMEMFQQVVDDVPSVALSLAEQFWPGPLTLVLPKSHTVPDEVTGGLQTVAVRIPGHPDALALIRESGCPISAPSANPFMALSPTEASHIDPMIQAGLACVLDGGPCEVGVESTVVDCSDGYPVILRPGGISRELIEEAVGATFESKPIGRRSPGSYRKHYSPRTQLDLVKQAKSDEAGLVFGSPQNSNQIQMPTDPVRYAAHLYRSLYELDHRGLDRIVLEPPPRDPSWEAVWDRIMKAAVSD